MYTKCGELCVCCVSCDAQMKAFDSSLIGLTSLSEHMHAWLSLSQEDGAGVGSDHIADHRCCPPDLAQL